MSSKDQTWGTPRYFFRKLDDIFAFDLDPCCEHHTAKCKKYFTKEEDGLKQDWSAIGDAFVNPPFGRALPLWMKKCQEEAAKGITVVMLIPARPDTIYWHDIAFKYASCVCFIRGRIKFGDEGQIGQFGGAVGAPFPSALIVFGSCTAEQKQQLKQFGQLFDIQRQTETEVLGAKALRTPPTSNDVGIRAGDIL
jgi:site-specific DNA-methyltransferase (adenine-specific)